MSDPNDVQKIERYTAGLVAGPAMQSPDAIDGDPQYASLCTFLAAHCEIGSNGRILDIGAGHGVLARAVEETEWRGGTPWYVAIDLPDALERLHLPPITHNHSRKVELADFHRGGAGPFDSVAAIAVLRNLLHELDIGETAHVFRTINSQLPPASRVFIQDMADLPDGESRNAPWSAHRLKDALRRLGMDPTVVSFTSRSGTPWFSISAVTNPGASDLGRLGDIFAEARAAQSEDLAKRLEAAESGSLTTAQRELVLPRDRNTIDLQLRAWWSSRPTAEEAGVEFTVRDTPITLRPGTREHFLSEVGAADVAGAELVGTLMSKDAIDMALTIERANQRVWFWGYSNKHICDAANADAVRAAVERGVDVRVLLVDPASDAAGARSKVPAYQSPDRLLGDICDTVSRARELRAAGPWADVRLSSVPPPASYFIIDGFCVASHYTSLLTGTSAPSVIFGAVDSEATVGGTLLREYVVAFHSADQVAGGLPL